MNEVIHYPNLKTVLMVEKVLQEAELTLSRNEIMRRLPNGIMRPTLNLILDYLESSGKVAIGSKGILWVYNDSPKFLKMLKKGVRV